jgi:hypothetical protein
MLNIDNEEFYVNQLNLLIFYHFSNYKYTESQILNADYDRYHFQNRSDLRKIYQLYQNELISNNIENFSRINCYYMLLRQEYLNEENYRLIKKSKKKLIKYHLKRILPPIVIRLIRTIKN